MNKKFWKAYILYVVVLLAILFAALHFLSQSEESQTVWRIVNKYEKDGKCFVEVQIEISPEEYIGYDIGDDYTAK